MRHPSNIGKYESVSSSRIDPNCYKGSKEEFLVMNKVYENHHTSLSEKASNIRNGAVQYAGNVVKHALDTEITDLISSFSVATICTKAKSPLVKVICAANVSFVSYEFIQEAKIKIKDIAYEIYSNSYKDSFSKGILAIEPTYRIPLKSKVCNKVLEKQEDDAVLNCFHPELIEEYTNEIVDLECAGYTQDGTCNIM